MDNTKKADSSKEKSKSIIDFNKEIPAILAELLFVFLPLLVLAILHAAESRYLNIITTPEWSFAASILFGLSIVKLIMGVSARDHSFNWQGIGLVAALILVFGLVPSLIILSVVFHTAQPPIGFLIAQLFMFIMSACCFVLFGTAGQMLVNTAFRQKIMRIITPEENK